MIYAGFWKRTLGHLIDLCAIYALIILMAISLNFTIIVLEELYLIGEKLKETIMVIVFLFAILIIPWLYYALMEASRLQATLGKLALGLIVVDKHKQKITFGRATGRYWASCISSICYIGYFISAFDPTKQTLHDMLAKTFVIGKEVQQGSQAQQTG